MKAYIIYFSALIILAALTASAALAETEQEFVEKIDIKIKLKEFKEGAAILETALKDYPDSVAVRSAAVRLSEASGNVEELAAHAGKLVDLLMIKEVKDGSLSPENAALLKETKKKLEKAAKFRSAVDDATDEFFKAAETLCDGALKNGAIIEASYIFERAKSLKSGWEKAEEIERKLAESKEQIVAKREDNPSADSEKLTKLILDGQKSYKAGKLDDAAISCKAALEVNPAYEAAIALLYDISDKKSDRKGVLFYGLLYLSLDFGKQSVKRSEEMAKRLSDESGFLKDFFTAGRKASDKIWDTAKSAMAEKADKDVEYCISRAQIVCYRTKKADETLKKTGAAETAKQPKAAFTKGRLIADEKFGSPNNLWYQCEGYAYFQSGKYYLKSDLERPYRGGYARDFSPKNFCIEVDMQIDSTPNDRSAAGIQFRLQNNATFYAFLISPSGNYGVWAVTNGDKKDLTGKDASAASDLTPCVPCKAIKKGKEMNALSAVFVGDELHCYVNGLRIFSCKDSTLPQTGTMGCFVAKGGHLYTYDNFKVYDAQPLGSGK